MLLSAYFHKKLNFKCLAKFWIRLFVRLRLTLVQNHEMEGYWFESSETESGENFSNKRIQKVSMKHILNLPAGLFLLLFSILKSPEQSTFNVTEAATGGVL